MKKIDAILIIILVTVGLVAPIAIINAHKQQEQTELIANIEENGGWSMNEIHLKLDQDNVLTMVSHDVMHSFVSERLNISVMLYPGHTVTVHIHPTKAGEYLFECEVFCSPKHVTMNGVIIVE